MRIVESDLAAPDTAPNWMCKDDYNKNATAADTAPARMMLINIILTVPVLAIRSTDCITPCLQALFYSSFVYSLCMGPGGSTDYDRRGKTAVCILKKFRVAQLTHKIRGSGNTLRKASDLKYSRFMNRFFYKFSLEICSFLRFTRKSGF